MISNDKLLKLHGWKTGGEIWIRYASVRFFYWDSVNNYTRFEFVGKQSEDDYVCVEETPRQILELLNA